MSYAISWTLRFEDAEIRRAYYDHFWQTPRRLFLVAATAGLTVLYYATLVGLQQLPIGTANQWRLSVGGRREAFSAPICAWAAVISAYFLLLGFRETQLAAQTPLLSSCRRPPVGWLNPSAMGLGKQNALLACLFWGPPALRIVATFWRPAEVMALNSLELTQWTLFEILSFFNING